MANIIRDMGTLIHTPMARVMACVPDPDLATGKADALDFLLDSVGITLAETMTDGVDGEAIHHHMLDDLHVKMGEMCGVVVVVVDLTLIGTIAADIEVLDVIVPDVTVLATADVVGAKTVTIQTGMEVAIIGLDRMIETIADDLGAKTLEAIEEVVDVDLHHPIPKRTMEDVVGATRVMKLRGGLYVDHILAIPISCENGKLDVLGEPES